MSTCRLIVCEKAGRWAAALRSALANQPPRIVETRSLAGCEAALAESPYSLVALETTATNLEAVLAFVERVLVRFPRSHVAALFAPEARGAALLLQEAGAIATIESVLDASRVACFARRQLAQAPSAPVGPQESVCERMPWRAFATATQPTS
jgi:hypothetical protein